MDMRKLVGRNFARLRAASGLTQEQVAERAEVSQQYVSGLERGERNPSLQTLQRIAGAFGVSHVELVMPDLEAFAEETPAASPPRPSQ